MTLADYLASEAAREHAALMLQDPQARRTSASDARATPRI